MLKKFKYPFTFLLFWLLVSMLVTSCRKSEQRISGRYVNAITKQGLAKEGFEIVRATDHGFFTSLDKRTTIKTTYTDDDGYFDFGPVSLKKNGNASFVVGNTTSERFTDVYKFAGAASISIGEANHYYDFFIAPAFKWLHVYYNPGALSAGDSLTYQIRSQYLKETNDEAAFVIKGGCDHNVPAWSDDYYKGPMGKYFVSIRKKINNVVTFSYDTLWLDKGQTLEYTINFY